jgi:membrane-bound lytic murein transglycosylase F
MDIPSTFDVKHTIEFSEPVFKSRQVLVQRKPDNWRKMKDMKDVESLMVKNLDQFKGKTIVLPAGKETQFYLFDLQHATGNQLSIISQPESNSAKMIEAVAAKEADYTIAYAHTANALSMIYRDLDVKTPVSPEIGISWVVRKGASNLLYEMNNWIAENRNHGEFDYLYAKYYKNPRWARLALGQKVSNDRISDYDEILKQASSSIGWDWRLLAAIVYNESKFKPDAVSHRGAFGLMQLMPETAKRFGASMHSTPAEQIAAGVRLIKYLDGRLKSRVPDPEERKKFIIAAYNIGLAHIYDAYNLAEKHNKNPEIWADNVEFCLLSKSDPQFYNDPVVKYGRVSGKETQRFVSNVMEKYDHYKLRARM